CSSDLDDSERGEIRPRAKGDGNRSSPVFEPALDEQIDQQNEPDRQKRPPRHARDEPRTEMLAPSMVVESPDHEHRNRDDEDEDDACEHRPRRDHVRGWAARAITLSCPGSRQVESHDDEPGVWTCGSSKAATTNSRSRSRAKTTPS